jgi:glycerophosphoryl diester phosphodiesterase
MLTLITHLHAAPKLIAHRGSSDAAPENTLAAFKLAWEEEADGIEGDFRMSKDGRVVCIHDEDTRRTTDKKFVVANTDWEQLKSLDAGSWKSKRYTNQRLPLLEEILAILPPDKFFFIEIKCGPEIAPALSQILKGADSRHVFIISYNSDVIAACRKLLPNFQAHLVSKLPGIQKPENQTRLLEQLASIEATGLQFKHTARITGGFIGQLRKSGRMTACWTVDSPKTAGRIAALGVDFITTNRPAILRRQTNWPD